MTQGKVHILTPAEIDILYGIAEGLSTKEIALQRGVSRRTVAHQLRDVRSKLRARNRTEAVVVAIREGLLSLHRIAPLPPRKAD